MLVFFSYTLFTVLTVDLLATSGDIAITWTSPIIPKLLSNDTLVNPFPAPITEDEETWISSLINIGAMIGPFPFALIARRFGRKNALLSIAIPHIIAYLTLALSKSVYLYYFARTLGGVAVGGGYTLLPMYIAEIAEDSNRGTLSVTLNIFWTFGNLLSYIIGPYTSILWFNVTLACVPTFFFIVFFVTGPESPYYLVTKNRIPEAETCLMRLRSNDKKLVKSEIKQIQLLVESEENKANFLDLFKSRACLKGIIISVVLIVAQQLSGINVVLFYTQEIFASAGASSLPPEIASILTGVICFAASFGVPFTADRFERRFLLKLSCLGTSLALVVFGFFFYLKSSTAQNVAYITWLPVGSLVFYFFMFTIGLGPLPWTISSELFPTNIKPYAAAITSFLCWTTSFIVTKFFANMNHVLGESGTFCLFGGFSFATYLFVLFFTPETRGRSFKDIQDSLEN